MLPRRSCLVPTRELALQVTEELSLLGAPQGIRVAAVYGGAPVAAQAKRLRGAHIVVATPGRLNDLVQRRLISLDAIRILVLDEADRMLDMGFQPQVEQIVRLLPKRAPDDALLGHARRRGRRARRAYTTTRRASRPSCRRSTPTARSTTASSRSRPTTRSTASSSCSRPSRGLALVFVRTKRGADRLAHEAARPRRRRRRDARRHDAGRARAGARALPLGQGDDARRDRRRRARPRPRRRSAT